MFRYYFANFRPQPPSPHHHPPFPPHTQYPSVRPFYIRLEVPETAKLGEQIGVRVSVFNYWDRPIECLVTLHSSPDYRFVLVTNEVKEQSSYSPETTDGDIQTMVYVSISVPPSLYSLNHSLNHYLTAFLPHPLSHLL